MKFKLALLFIIILALSVRVVGVNWDQDQHLHPDERFLTMVAERMDWTYEYFNTKTSTLNPHNIGYSFFVYGTYPIIFVKGISQILHMHEYGGINIVGRVVSAIVDIGTLLTVVALTSRLWGKRPALWAGFAYSISVLPIQLSHFFATDPYSVFFMMLSVYFMFQLIDRRKIVFALLLGLCFGLALAAKISSIVLAPTIGLGLMLGLRKNLREVFLCGVISLFAGIFSLRIFMPYLFDGIGLNREVLSDWQELKSYDNPNGYFPPATMWINTVDYIFPLENMTFWGFGIPLFAMLLFALLSIIKQKNLRVWLVWFAIVSIFAFQGSQFTKPMRYFFIVYPLSAVLIGQVFYKMNRYLKFLVVVLCAIWPLAFTSIYLSENPRVVASKWIYNNIALGSNISCEHWDDCLPLNIVGSPGNSAYTGVELPMYYPDTDEKWQEIGNKLTTLDYLILSSNRVYGSTMSVPEKYPINTKFYRLLFAGELGFEKIVEFTNRPRLNIPIEMCIVPPKPSYGIIAPLSGCQNLSFVDDYADETFTVYDHPKVTIFKKIKQVGYLDLLLK